jgi:hypothetical protein
MAVSATVVDTIRFTCACLAFQGLRVDALELFHVFRSGEQESHLRIMRRPLDRFKAPPAPAACRTQADKGGIPGSIAPASRPYYSRRMSEGRADR